MATKLPLNAFEPCGKGTDDIPKENLEHFLKTHKLWVNNIPNHVTSKMLFNEFDNICKKFNKTYTVLEAVILGDRETRTTSQCYGFVILSNKEVFRYALENKIKICGKLVHIGRGFNPVRDVPNKYKLTHQNNQIHTKKTLSNSIQDIKRTLNIQHIQPINMDMELNDLNKNKKENELPIFYISYVLCLQFIFLSFFYPFAVTFYFKCKKNDV